MMHKYEVIIYYSNEDGAFVAEVPELAGCAAHGDSHEAALGRVNEAVGLWLETAEQLGTPIPEHNGRAGPHKSLGQWLVENAPKGVGVKEPKYDEEGRLIAFSDIAFDE